MGMPYIDHAETIPTYTVAMASGAVLCFLLALLLKNSKGISLRHRAFGAVAAIFAGLVGAKLFFVFQNWNGVVGRLPFVSILLNGFVFYGGLIGGAAGIVAYCLIFRVNIIDYFDFAAILLPLGTAIGRLGCLAAGCCFGRETHGIFGVIYTDSMSANTPIGVPVLPTQLFEFGYCMLIFAALLALSRKPRQRGLLCGVYLVAYGVCRFINEFFRADQRGTVGFLSTSQFVSVIIFALVAAYAVFFYLRKKSGKASVYFLGD